MPTDGIGHQKIAGIDTLQTSHVNFTPSNRKLDFIWGRDPWADVVEFRDKGQYPIEGLYELPGDHYRALTKKKR